jgi:hypothetical protein
LLYILKLNSHLLPPFRGIFALPCLQISLHVHVFVPFRPVAVVSYEHMFPSSSSSLARRALGALRLTRSFLMLEDDYSVDWEVDWDEPSGEAHPHRAPLRGGFVRRRPGEPATAPQPCLSPIVSANGASQRRSQRRSSEMMCDCGVLQSS